MAPVTRTFYTGWFAQARIRYLTRTLYSPPSSGKNILPDRVPCMPIFQIAFYCTLSIIDTIERGRKQELRKLQKIALPACPRRRSGRPGSRARAGQGRRSVKSLPAVAARAKAGFTRRSHAGRRLGEAPTLFHCLFPFLISSQLLLWPLRRNFMFSYHFRF